MPGPLDFGPLAALSAEERVRLQARAEPVALRAGETLIREGEAPTDVFAILDGRIRVTSESSGRTLAVLAAPALIGEIAVVADEPRSATVVAATAVRALRIPAIALRAAIGAEPEFAAELRAFAAVRAARTFVQRSSPFADLPSEAVVELAATFSAAEFAPGDVLVREGERADDAYLIRSGEVEIVRGPEAGAPIGQGEARAHERLVTTLGAGSFVGEVSALTGAPRSATVRARTRVEAFRLAGDDVRPIVRRHRAVVDRLESTMQSRHAPRRTGPATVEPAPDDPRSVILHDDRSGAYLRLTRDALAIYEDLDGDRSLRDLALRHFERTGALDPQGVFTTIATLQASGLVSAPRIATEGTDARVMRIADLILAPRYELGSADRIATALHRVFGALFTPIGAAVAVAIGTVGIAAFASLFRLASPTDFGIAGIAVAFVGLLVAGIGHEAAHAIATKVEGRRVGRAGIGLLWLTPVIYVDTSDTWLLDRRRRALINAAGPLFNYALAGVFGLLAALTTGLVRELMLWNTVVNLVSVVFNLSPLLEFDGYYVLCDLTNVNALRRKALRYVFGDLVVRPRAPRTRLERGYVLYAGAALLYVLVVSAVVLIGVPNIVDGIFAERVESGLRVAVGSLIAVALAALLVGPFVGEVFAARAPDAAT